MSKGKYSPTLTRAMIDSRDENTHTFNALKEPAPDYVGDTPYDEKVHFGNYDREGFDYYGYSAWYADGSWAGMGNGVDRAGYTEDDYLTMTDDEFLDVAGY